MRTKEINHHCKVCGVGYHACDDCDKHRAFLTWRSVACRPEHFQAYMLLHEYSGGHLTKNEVRKAMIELINIDDISRYPEPSKGLLCEIFAEPKPRTKQRQTKPFSSNLSEPSKVNT